MTKIKYNRSFLLSLKHEGRVQSSAITELHISYQPWKHHNSRIESNLLSHNPCTSTKRDNSWQPPNIGNPEQRKYHINHWCPVKPNVTIIQPPLHCESIYKTDDGKRAPLRPVPKLSKHYLRKDTETLLENPPTRPKNLEKGMFRPLPINFINSNSSLGIQELTLIPGYISYNSFMCPAPYLIRYPAKKHLSKNNESIPHVPRSLFPRPIHAEQLPWLVRASYPFVIPNSADHTKEYKKKMDENQQSTYDGDDDTSTSTSNIQILTCE